MMCTTRVAPDICSYIAVALCIQPVPQSDLVPVLSLPSSHGLSAAREGVGPGRRAVIMSVPPVDITKNSAGAQGVPRKAPPCCAETRHLVPATAPNIRMQVFFRAISFPNPPIQDPYTVALARVPFPATSAIALSRGECNLSASLRRRATHVPYTTGETSLRTRPRRARRRPPPFIMCHHIRRLAKRGASAARAY